MSNQLIRSKMLLPQFVESAKGIEIELEGLHKDIVLPEHNQPHVGMVGTHVIEPHAFAHLDRSLRNGGIEFVTRILTSEEDIEAALNCIEAAARKLKLKASNRAGIHVHENVQNLTFTQAWNYLCTYILLEPAIFAFIGEGRERSIYSRPLYGHLSYETFRSMRAYLEASMFPVTEHKYYALNTASLSKFGTFEYRHMKSTLDFDRIRKWLNILSAVKTISLSNPDVTKYNITEAMGLVPSSWWHFASYSKVRDTVDRHCLPMLHAVSKKVNMWQRGTKSQKAVAESPNLGFQAFMQKRKVPKLFPKGARKPTSLPASQFWQEISLMQAGGQSYGNSVIAAPPNLGQVPVHYQDPPDGPPPMLVDEFTPINDE